jgi:hypothetical protein
LAAKDSTNNSQKIVPISPTIIPTPTIEIYNPNQEIDGATNINYSTEQLNILKKISELRDKLPINNNVFDLTFDYKSNRFIVNFKGNITNKDDVLKKWLIDNSYQNIPGENFTIK